MIDDLKLPEPKKLLPDSKRLTMEQHIEFVLFSLKDMNLKAIRKQKEEDRVQVRFVLK